MAEAEAAIVTGDMLAVAATSFGLRRMFLAAALMPTWGYFVVLLSLWAAAVYYVLDLHIVGDLLSGWKGYKIGLYYSPHSPVAAMLLSKCEVLKQRSPQVDYQRQLYVTVDGGTVALDWVKGPAFREDKRGKDMHNNVALDDTPIAIIIPGLTSDCTSHYVKHIAHRLSEMGWRVLVANHRGLGGVSITSEQFYNAGWTEDLQKIVSLVHETYPKSPLLAVGLSIGANILVKYLGEEGPRTPLGGAVAIGCPWDLLVCDRFMSRPGVQSIYNKALAVGLQQYAQLHQTALARMIDWDLLQKSANIRDFDDYCTRHVGKFATVDTYYRTCSSVRFLETISIPLLCISAEDDPICTKEAIPYDECRVNPNVILGVSRHGGHLAYFEGLDATSLWWVRASAEFFRVLLSSSHMHQQGKIGVAPSTGLGSNIDKGPFLTVGQGLAVPTKDPARQEEVLAVAQKPRDELSGLETQDGKRETGLRVGDGSYMPMDESLKRVPSRSVDDAHDVANSDCGGSLYRAVIQEYQTASASASCPDQAPDISNHTGPPSASADTELECRRSVTIKFRNASEMAALRSAMTQILHQVPSSLDGERANPRSSSQRDSGHTTSNRSRDHEIPVTPAAAGVVEGGTDLANRLLVNEPAEGKLGMVSADEQIQTSSRQSEEERPGQWTLRKDLAGLATQNRRTIWLLTYVAVMTTFPLLRTAFLVRTKGRLLDIVSRHWKRMS